MPTTREWMPALLVAVSLAAPVAAAPTERVEVRRVRLPVVLEPRAVGACDAVTAGQVEITEDGKALRALHLEPRRLETIHAVLLDTGPDTLRMLGAARAAARSYVRALPPDEPVMLATIDERLILHASASTDRAAFERHLDLTEIGRTTRLWDSTHRVIDYLRTRPERKVLLLLTSGCDRAEASRTSAEDVIRAAERIDSLSVFTIGLGVPSSCTPGGADPIMPLRRLAQRTGGEFHALESSSGLDAALGAVRTRLERERFVTYAPLPFGAGPKDRPNKEDHRWRQLAVRLRPAGKCRISLGGPQVRYESESLRFFGAAPAVAGGAVVEPFALRPDRRQLRGRVRDGRQIRDVDGLVPDLATVVGRDARPEDAFVRALAAVARFGAADDTAGDTADAAVATAEPAFMVGAGTLLDIRGSLSAALAEDPDYGEWAFERIRTARLEELDERIRDSDAEDERELLTRVKTIIAGDSWAPEPHEIEARLGGWLTDLYAPRLFNESEAWLAQQLLDTDRDGERATAEVERLWGVLRSWLIRPPEQRSIGLLVPAYDRAQEAIGFYRIILGEPTSTGMARQLIEVDPSTFLGTVRSDLDSRAGKSLYHYFQSFFFSLETPLAPRLTRWLGRQDELAEPLADLVVHSVHYTTPSSRNLRETLVSAGLVSRVTDRKMPLLARLVVVVFALRDDPSRRFAVGAYFALERNERGRYGDEPLCLLRPSTIDPGPETALWSALTASKRRSAFDCVLRHAAE